LQNLWYKKLKDTGFNDIETTNGFLKNPDIRTINWQNREKILEFYLALDSFLNHCIIPMQDRLIMELYSEGVFVTGKNGIAKQANISIRTTWRIISYYKKIVIKTYGKF
jgi:hypothetical protein